MREPAAIVLWIGLTYGCGSGGTSLAESAVEQPSPTATASMSAPTPALSTPRPDRTPTPSPSPTPSNDDVVLLGVGEVARISSTPDGPALERRPLIVRLADDVWTIADMPELPSGWFLLDVTFSSDTTAWAWGWIGNDDSFVLTSTDGGKTWELASEHLPPVGQLTDLWFENESTGWAVGGSIVGGLWVDSTRDAGETWQQLDHDFGPARLGHRFGSRAGVVEVVYNGRVLQEVDPVPDEAHEFVPEGFAGESFATFGERGWYGGSLDQSPSIISADQGAEWTVQHVEFRGQGRIRSIDFRDPSNGVACGAGVAPGEFEDHLVCVYTTNGGETWAEAVTPADVITPFNIDVVWGPGNAAWTTTWSIDPLRPVLLRSADGGRTWQHAEIPFRGDGLIRRLARSSETQGRE